MYGNIEQNPSFQFQSKLIVAYEIAYKCKGI